MEGVENLQIDAGKLCVIEIMMTYMFTSLLIQNLENYVCIYFSLRRVCK